MVKQLHKIVAVCDDLPWTKEPFEKRKNYPLSALQKAYSKLFLLGENKKLKFIETNFTWYDRKTNRFRKGWIYDQALGWKHIFDFKADFVFDKSSLSKKHKWYKKLFTKQHRILNPFYIEELCSDKLKTYELFPFLVPKTFVVHTKKVLLKKLKLLRTAKAVIKPRFGTSAVGVRIVTVKEALRHPPSVRKNTLLQEFVTCKNTDKFRIHYGVYDLRVILNQGRIIDQFYRVSKKGVMTSNTATGGTTHFIRKNALPKKILSETYKIDRKLKKLTPRLYTLDFVIDTDNRVWLIEMNSKPGFFFSGNRYAKNKRMLIMENAIVKSILRLSKRIRSKRTKKKNL
jgi:glutathione synthase/RimK-type ligase-like ATP-grasp enzyme